MVDLDGAQTELDAIQKDISRHQNNLRERETPLHVFEAERDHMEALVERMRDDLKTMQVEKMCPLCGQRVQGKEAQVHIKKELRQTVDMLAQYEDQAHEVLVERFTSAQNQLSHLITASAQYKQKVIDAQARVELYTPRFHDLDAKLKAITLMRDGRKDEPNPYHDQMQDLRRRKSKLKVRRKDLEADAAWLSRRIERTRYWVKGFKNIRLHVIDETLQELELTTNAMLEEVGLIGWQVNYDIEKETKSGTVQQGLNVSILSPRNDKRVRWECWSGGESQRLRLIGTLALSDVLLNHAGVVAGFEILDEPSAHLSTEGLSDLIEFLADRAASLQRQVWFVDHNAIESTHFESVLTIVKGTDGSSRVSTL